MELTYGYSAKDILFMQTISTLGSVFGIVPSYDYKKRKLIHKKSYRCYVLLLACFITSCSMASLYYRFKYEMFTVIIKTMDLFVEVTGLVLCLVAVLNSSLWNMKTWNKLIGQLSQLEGPSNLNTRGVRNGSLKRNPLVWFLFGCIFYMFLTLCNFFTMGRAMFVRHITQMVLHYAKFMSMIIMYPITLSIRVKYEDLKEMFVKVEAVIASRKDSVRILRKVRTLCLALDSVVESFNSFFGWPVLLLLAHSFAQFLCCLSILIRRGLRKESLTDFIILCYMIGDLVSTLDRTIETKKLFNLNYYFQAT